MSGDNFSRRYAIVAETRRRWSDAEKQSIIAEAARPDANISAVARRHGIKPSLLFRWRRMAREAEPRGSGAIFVPVTLALAPVSSVLQFSPIVGFEISQFAFLPAHSAEADPADGLSPNRGHLPFGEAAPMVQLGELMMILELHRQGLSVTAIARRTGRDPKTVRKYIERGIEAPAYAPRSVGRPSKLAPYRDFLRERVTAFPDLSAARLTREIRAMGYAGAYTAVKRYLAAIRPENGPKPYEVRFETPPGVQAQVDFARFVVDFTDDPGSCRIVWLFSLVLGHSRFLFARYVLHQDLQTLLRCHIQAFAAIGGVPIEILYDRMKTAVTGEDDQGHIIYNRSLLALARHYRFQPRACRPYRAKTKGKVERPFSYIRQDFFLGRRFRNLDDLNNQLADWLDTVANVRVHGTIQRIVAEAFTAEQPELQTLPEHRFDAVLKLERRVSHDGFVAIGGNYYSVPDRTRRVVEVQQLPDLIRILDLGIVVAEHPVAEGRKQYRIDRSHRTGGGAKRKPSTANGITLGRIGDHVPLRSLALYQAIGAQLAMGERP